MRLARILIPVVAMLVVSCGTDEADLQSYPDPKTKKPTTSRSRLLHADGTVSDPVKLEKFAATLGKNPSADTVLAAMRAQGLFEKNESRGYYQSSYYYYYIYTPYYWQNYYQPNSGSYNYSCSLYFGSVASNWNFDCINLIGGYNYNQYGNSYRPSCWYYSGYYYNASSCSR